MVRISYWALAGALTSVTAFGDQTSHMSNEHLAAALAQLTCERSLELAGDLIAQLGVTPESEVALQAKEIRQRLITAADVELAWAEGLQKLEEKRSGVTPEPPPSRQVALDQRMAHRRQGMLDEWWRIARAAFRFAEAYPPATRAKLAEQRKFFDQLELMAKSLITAVEKLDDIKLAANTIGHFYAEIMSVSHEIVDARYGDYRRVRYVKAKSVRRGGSWTSRFVQVRGHDVSQNLSPTVARLHDLLVTLGKQYDTELPLAVAARLDEPDVMRFLGATVSYVQSRRKLEIAAASRRNSRRVTETRELIKAHLRNDWSLISTVPAFSGQELIVIRGGLARLPEQLAAYAEPGQAPVLTEVDLELILRNVRDSRWLGQVILKAAEELPRAIDPPVAPAPIPPPETQGYEKSFLSFRTKRNSAAADVINVERERVHRELVSLQNQGFERAVHDYQFALSALIDRYDQRARARKTLLVYLAYLHPYLAFPMQSGSSSVLIVPPTPGVLFAPELNDSRDGEAALLALAYPAVRALRAEADWTVAAAFQGATADELKQVDDALDQVANRSPRTTRAEYRQWLTYAFAMLPSLAPQIDPPPGRTSTPRARGEYRPEFKSFD